MATRRKTTSRRKAGLTDQQQIDLNQQRIDILEMKLNAVTARLQALEREVSRRALEQVIEESVSEAFAPLHSLMARLKAMPAA
jgi:hypothetical protein